MFLSLPGPRGVRQPQQHRACRWEVDGSGQGSPQLLVFPSLPSRSIRSHCVPIPWQSIHPAPTANLDRTDDTVYSNVMDLVRAVLQLKNEISLLPPEEYIIVVKVGTAGRGQHQGNGREWGMSLLSSSHQAPP